MTGFERWGRKGVLGRRGRKGVLERWGHKGVLGRRGRKGVLERRGSVYGAQEEKGQKTGCSRA